MLTKDELKEIARFTRLKLYQQEKHYLQTIMLNSVYSSITNELVFKGGTALFFFYNLNRFSDDLDFSMAQPIKTDMVKTVKKDLELLGINNKIGRIRENDISLSFKIGAEGPLFSKEIERCYISIEISKREKVNHLTVKEVKSIYPDIPNFNACVMGENEVLAEKVRAVLTRNYARDLYDLFFLLNRNVRVDIGLINKKLSYYKKKFNKKEFIKNVNEKGDIWEAELKPLIIGELPKFSQIKNSVLKHF